MKYVLLKDNFIFAPKSHIKAGEGKSTGIYPFFTSSRIQNLYFDEYLFDFESVILGTGGMPSCNYAKGKYSVSTDNFVLKQSGTIRTKYLFYYLKNNNYAILESGFHGAGLKHIGKDYVSNIHIPYASYDEQTEIIENLDTINYLIDLKNYELAKYDELIKSRFICQEVALCF